MRGCRQLALLIWKNLRFQTRNHYVFIMLQIGCPLVILLWFVWVKIILPIKSLHPVVEEKSSPIIQTFVKSREHKLLRVGYAPATELTCFIITLMRDTIKSKNIPNHLVSFIDFETEKKLIKTVSNKVLNKNVDVSIIFNVFNESAHEFFSNNTVEDRSATDSNCRSFPGHRPGLNRTLQDVLKSLDVTIRPSVSLKTAAIWSAGSMLPKRKAVCDEDAMADHVYQGVNLLLLILMESLINQVNPAFPTLNLSTQGIQCMIAVEHPIQWLLKIVMPLMLSVSVFPAITTIFYDIAREKERRTQVMADAHQQVLQMMGVSRMIYHLSWAISTLCQTLLIVAVVTGMQFLPDPLKILTKSDPTVVFLLFLVYGLTLAATALLATSICLKAKTAVTAFALYNLAQTIPVIYSGYYCESIGRTERFVFSWLYLCALQFGCCSIVRFEMTGEGVNWENIFRPATKYDNFSVGASILMMVSCATVFVLLTILITTDCWHHCLCGVHVVAKKAYNQMTHRRHTRLKKGRKKNDEDSQDDHIDRNDPGDSRLIEPSNSTAFVQFDNVTVRDVRRPHALYDVYMKIHKNQTTVLLGHSPSGKSYIVKVITGIVHPSHGSVTVNGLPLQKCIQNQSLSIGFCPKYNYLFKLLSVKENVRLFLGLQRDRWKVPVTEVDEIVELSNLSFQHSISVGRLSQASVRLLAVTLACYKDTQLIILEDPTYGLSETQAGHLLHTLKRILIGRTTLITSSTAMVASCLAQKIGVFTNGKLLCFGSTDYVMELFGAGYELEIHCTSMCGMESLTNYMMLLIPNLLLLESSSKKMTYFLPETSTVKFEYLLSNLKMRDKELEIVDFHINCITMEELFTRMTDENTLRSHFIKYVCHRQSLDTFSLGSALDVAVSRPRVLYSILCRTPSGIFNPFKSLCPDEYSRSCDQHGHSNTLTSVLLRAVQTDEAMGFFTPPLGSQVDDVGRELDSRLNRIFQSDTLRPRTPSEKFGNNKTAKFKAFLKPLTPVCPSKKWDDRISGKRNKNINAKKCLFSGDNISNDQLFETEFTVGGSSRSTKRRKSSMPVDGQPEQRFESCKDQKDKQCQTLRHQNVPSKFPIKSEIYADRRRRKTINPFSKVPQKSKSYEKQQCGKGHCKSQKHTVSCLASPRKFCLRNTKIRCLGPFKRTGRSLAREDEPYALVNKGNISYNRHENSSLSVSKTSTQLNVSWNEETTVNICRNSMDDQGYAKSLRLRLLLAERMEPGMCMSLTKFWGLLVQKALYSFRACTVTCLQLFLPVCLLIIGLTLYRKENLIQEKKIVLDSSHLQDTTVIYVNDSKEIHVREVIETYKDILKGSSETQHPRVIERSRLPVSRNLQIPETSYGLDDILIGAKFSSQATGSKPSLNLTAYYSLQAYHSEPLSIAMIMKTLQRYDQPDNNQTVSLSLQPLPLTHFDLFKDQFEQTHNHCCWIATTVVISLTSAISMFAVLPIKERMSGWKHLRSLSGVSSFLNLTSSLLWDLLICGLACLLILLTLIFWERATFEDTAFLYLFILVSDGMAGLFMIYTVQQIFQNPAHCVLLMFVTSSFIVSAFLLLTAHTWENVFESSRKSYLSDYKLYFTSLFPFCHLLLSLYGILLHAEKETFCYPLRKVCSVPTITCKSICKELVPHRKAEILEIHFSTMLLGTFVWAAVCFIVDKNLEYTPGKLKPETKQTEEEEDSVIADPHVAAEKMRVNQESFDARECLLLKNISRNQNGLGQLKGVSIAIAKGERFCLLGSKLSGKTALLEILTGKYRPWIGTILYNLLQKSETSSKTLLRIGYCPQKPVLMNELTGRETLVLYARLNGTPLQSLGAKVNELLETLHMLEVADKLCGDYRPSDRKMLSLAIALISNPHLLVLDEPTMNMDIVNSYRIWNILSNIQLDQGVLFLATSNTEECAVLCKRVGILANGRLLSLLPLDVLESRHATGYTCIVFFKNHDEEVQKLFFASVTDAFFGAQIIGDNDSAHIHFADDETNLAKLFSLMEDGKAYFNVERYMVQKTSLNHVMYFLSVCPDVEYFEAAPEASPSWTYWPPERFLEV